MQLLTDTLLGGLYSDLCYETCSLALQAVDICLKTVYILCSISLILLLHDPTAALQIKTLNNDQKLSCC